MAQSGQIATQTSGDITKSFNNTGMAAQSMSMRFMQMRSGLSATRDVMMGVTAGGQRMDMMFMAAGHHFTSLINETGSLKGAFSALGSSLMGAGGVILGLTLAYELFQQFSKGAKDAYDATSHFASAAEAQKQVINNLDDSYKTAVSNVSELTKNVQLAKDGFISKSEVVKEYNDTLGKTMGAVKSLNEVEAKLVSGAPDYIKMMLYKAAAQTALKEASDKALEAAKVQMKPVDSFGSLFDKMPVMNQSAADVKNSAKNLLDAQVAAQKEAKKKFTDDQADLLKIFNDFQDKAAAIAAKHKWSFIPDQKTGKAKEAVTGLDLMKQKLAELKTAWDDAAADGKPFEYLQKMAAAYERMAQKIADVEEKIRKSSFAGGGAPALDDAKSAGVTTPELTNQGQDIEAEVKRHKELQDAIFASRAKGAQWKQELKDENSLLKEVSRTIGTGLTQAFEAALSGSQNFFQAMGQFLTKLIEKLIATAAAAVILAAVISIATGGSVDAAGISQAISFGDAFKSSFSDISGIGRHATGGIFTQPRVGMFAEAGPEAIVTPQHLADFAGVQSGGMGGTLTMKLQGSDMLLFLDRAQKSQSRKS